VTRRNARDDPFDGVYVRLVSSGLLDGAKRAAVLALVSRVRGEGVTTLCVGLGRTIAATGKRVLLLDAAPVGTRAGAVLGLSAEPLTLDGHPDAAVVERAITAAPRDGFDVLAVAGAKLAEPEWAGVRDALAQRYDAIIVDTGSLDTDVPHRWRGAVDKTLLVMDAQQTTYEILERLKADLDHASFRLSGFVMNRRAFPVPALVYRLAH
jgi:Mrp family chromosome partitioning ATPase